MAQSFFVKTKSTEGTKDRRKRGIIFVRKGYILVSKEVRILVKYFFYESIREIVNW